MTKFTNGVKWYKKLPIKQKIALKECVHMLTGMRWEDFTILFTPRERLEIIYDKLELEGFDVS